MNDSNERSTVNNLAVIRGAVPNDPQARDLPAGGVVVQFDVTTRTNIAGREANASVPIAWNDPSPAQLAVVVAGIEVMVIGTVRRRFFRVGGATQSRTEVVADSVIPIRRNKQIVAALRDTADRLTGSIT